MDCKLFEVHDHFVYVPVLAVKLEGCSAQERALFNHSALGTALQSQNDVVLLAELNGGARMYADPRAWSGARTMNKAHEFIRQHFDQLASGAVIDVQFIVGETSKRRLSLHSARHVSQE